MSRTLWNEDPTELLRVRDGFLLSDVDPALTPGVVGKRHDGVAELARGAQELRFLQEKLFAQSRLGAQERVLVVLQAMDAAGKGGIVNHVFSLVEPYGLEVTSFKAPTAEERAHDFLWRVQPRLPGPGIIGVFDRSHYEDVLIQRVHAYADAEEIERRYGAIRELEENFIATGGRVVKIMLHISPEEQERRLRSRLNDPNKFWKFNPEDVDEREFWDAHMEAFQIMFDRTTTPDAPWFVVPANQKWYARIAVQRIVTGLLQEIDPQWPMPQFDIEAQKARLEATRDMRWPHA